jgi:hypothetical protein
MIRFNVIFLLMAVSALNGQNPLVDFDAYEKLVKEVKAHRKDRLVSLSDFLKMSKEKNVIILDTRSDSMFAAKHIKGAVHLNFSDFTQANLAKIIPNKNTKILIYCNNNFADDPVFFPTKAALPPSSIKKPKTGKDENGMDYGVTLALNIPTYINLYGYGYKNVYELKELVFTNANGGLFEGTSVK